MKYLIVNSGPASQGIDTSEGRRWVKAGSSGEHVMDDDAVKRAERIPGLTLDPLDADDAAKALSDHTVAELTTIAKAESIDLGDATKKNDIIAVIELHREAAAKA